jgi:hypothetical protein
VTVYRDRKPIGTRVIRANGFRWRAMTKAVETMQRTAPTEPFESITLVEELGEHRSWPLPRPTRKSGGLDVVPKDVVHPGLLGGWGCIRSLSPKEDTG